MLQQATNWAAGMQFVTVNFQMMIASVFQGQTSKMVGPISRSWISQEWRRPWVECRAMVTLCGWHRASVRGRTGRILNTKQNRILFVKNKAHEVEV